MVGRAKVPKFRKITKERKDENTKSDSIIHLLHSPRLLKKSLYLVSRTKARGDLIYVGKEAEKAAQPRLDPSTAFKPRSGSTLSMLRAGARGSRRVDSEFAFPYTP
jgi:hypothetical protein